MNPATQYIHRWFRCFDGVGSADSPEADCLFCLLELFSGDDLRRLLLFFSTATRYGVAQLSPNMALLTQFPVFFPSCLQNDLKKALILSSYFEARALLS